ncbi:sugar ABC transporter permease [Kribbella sp. NPDC050124]|uniref:sugar ABC transporter permease n=1 Tax=Kribbella sp. NPDC050124 TaxID=3364114 RepID=UPI00379C0F7C
MKADTLARPSRDLRADRWVSSSRVGQLVDAFNGRWRMIPVLATLALIWLFFASQVPAFLSARNLSNLSVQIVVTGILALGLVLVLLVGEIDLSVAALGGVTSAVMARLLVQLGLPASIAIAAGIATGVSVGIAQGIIVTRFRAPAFIVTLGSSLILQGVLLQLLPRTGQIPLAGTAVELVTGTYLVASTGYVIALLATALVALLSMQTFRHNRRQQHATSIVRRVVVPTVVCLAGSFVVVALLNAHRGVPVAVLILLGCLGVMAYVATQTTFGTYLYAIGGNAEAARRAGIRVRWVKVTTFALAGGFAAVAGLVAASRTLGVSSQSGGGTLLLEAVAAAVIGGASLFGGRGSVWAALLGALVIGSISNGLDLLGAEAQVKLIVQGTILILAVAVDGALSGGFRRSS